VNTQLMFPLDILPVRFTACTAIKHWSSSCHNNVDLYYSCDMREKSQLVMVLRVKIYKVVEEKS